MPPLLQSDGDFAVLRRFGGLAAGRVQLRFDFIHDVGQPFEILTNSFEFPLRFKARKIEAQRKLERVGQNLERLTDIVDEVEAQLNSTRSQAAKAAKYREVSVGLKQWWHGLAADDFRFFTAELEVVETGLAASSGRMDTLTEQQRQLATKMAALPAASVAPVRAQVEAVQARLHEAFERWEKLEVEYRRAMEKKIEASRERVNELSHDFREAREKLVAVFHEWEQTRSSALSAMLAGA